MITVLLYMYWYVFVYFVTFSLNDFIFASSEFLLSVLFLFRLLHINLSVFSLLLQEEFILLQYHSMYGRSAHVFSSRLFSFVLLCDLIRVLPLNFFVIFASLHTKILSACRCTEKLLCKWNGINRLEWTEQRV